jgi:hypothetical protein
MTPETRNIPAWTQRECQECLDWISENLSVFWMAAMATFGDTGRGAVVVDTTLQPVSGAGNLFVHFFQEQVEAQGDSRAGHRRATGRDRDAPGS